MSVEARVSGFCVQLDYKHDFECVVGSFFRSSTSAACLLTQTTPKTGESDSHVTALRNAQEHDDAADWTSGSPNVVATKTVAEFTCGHTKRISTTPMGSVGFNGCNPFSWSQHCNYAGGGREVKSRLLVTIRWCTFTLYVFPHILFAWTHCESVVWQRLVLLWSYTRNKLYNLVLRSYYPGPEALVNRTQWEHKKRQDKGFTF